MCGKPWTSRREGMPSLSAVWKATVRFSTILSLLRLLKSSAVGSKCAMSAQNARPSRQLVWKLVTCTAHTQHIHK